MTYRTIVADPPWEYDGFSRGHNGGFIQAALPYPSMTLRQIADLRVGMFKVRHLGAPDSRLFIWTTNRYLPDTFPIIQAWGYEYVQTLVWQKTNPNPNGGSVAPIGAEYLLVCVKGKPAVVGRWASSVISHSIGEHSAKPEVFLDLVEAVSPGPYIELFSRRARLGWDTWGNEALGQVDLLEVEP